MPAVELAKEKVEGIVSNIVGIVGYTKHGHDFLALRYFW
jgi:hypothetical protein